MPTDLTKITGSVPYVTVSDPTANPVEYVSEFVPLTAKEGDVLLNLSDGAYYEVTVAGSGTKATLVRGDAQSALVETAEPPYGIDGLAPYTAITDLYPSWNGDTVSYFDTRENPQTLFDYENFANNQYDMVFSVLDLPVADSGNTHEDFLANLKTWKDALADPETRVAIETWNAEGGLLALALAGTGAFDDTDYFDTNVALEESGLPWSSDLAQDAYERTGRFPQRGPADYLVVPGQQVVDPQVESLADLSAYMPAQLVDVIVGNSDRAGQVATSFEGGLPTASVPVYDRTAWADDESAHIGSVEVAWNGSAWEVRDLTAPDAVTDLAASSVTDTGLTLTWTNPADAAQVTVRRASGATAPATPSSGTSVSLSSATAESVSISGLSASTTYSFSVWVTDANGNVSEKASITQSTTAGD